MRLAELLGLEVVTEDGERLGRARDVRLAGRPAGNRPHLRAEALVVGAGAHAARWGYAEGRVTGPWLVAAVMRLVGRSSTVVPWSHVVDIDLGQGRIVVRRPGPGIAGPRRSPWDGP